MKRIGILTAILFAVFISSASANFMGIVDRTTTLDTLAIPYQFLDSLGQPVDGASNDSVYIIVWSPGGVEVFRDSMAYNDGSITSSAWEDYAGGNHYVYKERVSVLDGSSSATGTFTYELIAADNSLGLATPFRGAFEIVDQHLATVLAYLDTPLSTLEDSLYAALDSLQAYKVRIDSLQNALADSHIGDKVWTDGSFTPRGYLDAAISSRSTLTTSDNIGINWGDITNQTTAVTLSNTTIAAVTLAAGQFTKIGDTTEALVYTNRDDYKADVSALALEASLYDPTTDSVIVDVSSAASSLIPTIARENWTIAGPDDSSYAAGTMGKDAEGWDLTGASGGVDSTVLSNVLKRVIFGIAVGSGDDSTTLSQRNVLIADIVTAALDKIWEYDTSLIAAGVGSMLKDTSAYQGSGASAPSAADIYAEFISGSNEDAFKATGFSTHSAADVWAVGTRTLTAFGFNVSLAAGQFTSIYDSVWGISPRFITGDSYTPDVNIVSAASNSLDLADFNGPSAWWNEGKTGYTLGSFGFNVSLGAGQFTKIADTVLADSSSYQGAAAGVNYAGIDSSLTANHGSGSWQSGAAGSGPNAMVFLVIDTSGTDDTLSHVTLNFFTAANSVDAGPVETDGTGYASANLSTGSIQAVPYKTGYVLPDTTFTSGNNDTVIIYGYNKTINSPGGSSAALVYGYIYNFMDSAMAGVIVSVERLGGGNAVDSAGGTIVAPTFLYDTTDANGYFGWPLIRSNLFSNSAKAKYTIRAKYLGREILGLDSLTVPPTGDVDISDSLQAR